MSIKALIIAGGLVLLQAACSNSDEENTEEAVGMPGDGSDMAGMDSTLPNEIQPVKPNQAQQVPAAPAPQPTLSSIAANVNANVKAAEVKADAQASSAQSQAAAQSAANLNNPLAQPQAGQPNFFVRSAVLRVRSGPGKEHPTVGYITHNMQVTEIPGGNQTFAKIGNNKFVARSCLSHDKNSKQFIPGH